MRVWPSRTENASAAGYASGSEDRFWNLWRQETEDHIGTQLKATELKRLREGLMSRRIYTRESTQCASFWLMCQRWKNSTEMFLRASLKKSLSVGMIKLEILIRQWSHLSIRPVLKTRSTAMITNLPWGIPSQTTCCHFQETRTAFYHKHLNMVYVETIVLMSHKSPDSIINTKVEFGEGEGKVPLNKIAVRAKKYQPKPKITNKMIQEYVVKNYGFKVHTAYIAEVKRSLWLTMYDVSNGIEE